MSGRMNVRPSSALTYSSSGRTCVNHLGLRFHPDPDAVPSASRLRLVGSCHLAWPQEDEAPCGPSSSGLKPVHLAVDSGPLSLGLMSRVLSLLLRFMSG